MNEFKLGWPTLLAATIGTTCGLLTLTNYTQGFFVGPVIKEFGWTPGQFFLSYTIFMGAGLITAPIIGSLVPKYGVRTMGMLGLIGHAIGYFLISLNPNSLPLWYASWALLAILAAGSLPIIWTSALNGWFVKNRGKAIGITMAGTGLGAFFLPPVVEFFISNYGWRTAYRAIGFGALLISLPIVWKLFRENESTKGTELNEFNQTAAFKDTDAPDTNETVNLDTNETTKDAGMVQSPAWGVTREQAIRTRKFWILGAVLFLSVIVIAGLLSNFARIYGSMGLERDLIAKIAAVMGITVILGRLLVGALVDRFWAPAVASAFFVLPIIAMVVLLTTQTLTLGIGIFAAILIGLAAGAELDLLAYLTSKYFGPRHYAKIFGAIFAFFTVGAGIAPPLFGEMAANTGSYEVALKFAIVSLLVCIALFLMLGKYPEEANKESGH